MKVESDPRKCGIHPSPSKTVRTPRASSYRVRRTLERAQQRAAERGDTKSADRIRNYLSGYEPLPQERVS